uniref:Treacher Collins-Franceschetti syndrome 1 n=1 Tax=Xenopus tropicalis TaxID=8364 RepID=A0A6I8R3H7_XENTR
MKEVEGSLLALIHQHLLQAGYSKAARELQMQSGKKFSTPEVSLQDIYKDWIKHPEKDKTKKTVQVNNQGVKVRVPDPESSTESSEDELVFYSPAGSRTLSNATPQVQQTKEKNNKKKPTAKEKAATTISKMSSGVNATSGQNKKAVSAIPQAPKVVMESSSSSDSEEDQAPQKAAPVKISTKPVAESTESSSGSESDMETTGQNVVGKKLTANNLPATPGSVKKPLPNAAPNGKVASQAKAIVKPDLKNISESSDSSDSEEENESQTHTVLAHVHAPPRTPLLSPSKTARAAVPAKAAVVTKPVDIDESESSDSSDSEIIVTQASQKKPSDPTAAKPLVTKTPNLAQPGKVATPTKTPVSAKPLTAQSSESSDSSDSEEELNAKNTAAPLQASQKKTIVPPTSTRPPGTKTPLLAKPGTLTTPAKASVVAQSSESSDSSDSELEPDAKKTAAPLQGSQKNIPATPSTATRPPGTKTPLLAKPGKLATPTKASVVAKPLAAQSSESSDSSDSEEEPDTKKTAVPLQGSQKKTPVTPSTAARPPGTKTPLLAKPGTLATPAKASVVPQSSESSDSSDSELEPDAKKTAASLQGSQKNTPATRPPGTKTPLLAKPGNLATPAKASMVAQPPAAQSSESSDLSDSEEEPNAKKTAAPLQGSQKKTPATAARPPETKAPLLAKPGKLATPTKASVVAQPLAAQSSESSDSSDSEEEPDAKKTAAPLQGSQKKTPATPSTATRPPGTKTPLLTKPGKLATPTKTPVISLPLAESSDSSESEDEPAVKNAQLSVVASKNNSKTTLLAKTGKLAAPAKTPAVTQPPVAESSESSNSSDSEEELNNKQKTAAPPQASQKKGKSPLLASTGNAATPAKTPVVAQPLTAQSSESSNSSDSEEEPDAKKINASLNPTTSASQAFATMKPTAKQDCDSSDTSEEAEGKSRSLVGQPSVTIISETSDTTDIDEVVSPTPAPIKATKGKAVPILAKTVTPSSLKATKSKASSAAKTAKAVQQIAVANSDSSDSLDSDEDPGVKQTPSVPLKKVKSGKGAKLTAVCVSGGNQKLPSSLPVPSLQKPSVSDVSEPSDSSDSDIDTGAQSLVAPVHAVPTPQKRKRNPKVKAQVTQPPAASVKHKKKSKAEQLAASAQPAPEPVIDSEEETIMALLSGQSPKKGKQKLSKLGLKAAPSATPLPVQKNGSVSDSSDDSDIGTATLNIVTPPALELRPPTADKEKKSAKKRKSSSEDGPKKKAKKAKKEGKKEKKKSKAEGGEAGASTPKAKSSKKDKKKLEKSEKKKSSKKKKEKKKKDGEKKEAKKTKKGSATGVSPKPKKKKKSKADKVD